MLYEIVLIASVCWALGVRTDDTKGWQKNILRL